MHFYWKVVQNQEEPEKVEQSNTMDWIEHGRTIFLKSLSSNIRKNTF